MRWQMSEVKHVAENSTLGEMCVSVAQAVANTPVLPLDRLGFRCLRSWQMRVGVGWSQLMDPFDLGKLYWSNSIHLCIAAVYRVCDSCCAAS
jgi:hypothetical protein